MKTFNTINGAERNTSKGNLIIELSRDNGERIFITHIDDETNLRLFRSGDHGSPVANDCLGNLFSFSGGDRSFSESEDDMMGGL